MHSVNYLQLLSIVFEAAIAVLFFLIALRGKSYFYGLTFTFVVYVFYDLSKLYNFGVSSEKLSYLFFAATISALWSAWGEYKK